MSKVNIKRTVENIRANTTAYSPIVEAVVNAIQAIESTGRQDGKIVVRIQRDGQMQMDSESLADIRNFEVEDNGIGFTPANRESFDTLYSDFKMTEGGKGFGRFICLKYFDNVHVDSVYAEEKAGPPDPVWSGNSNVSFAVKCRVDQRLRTKLRNWRIQHIVLLSG
jgi:anti-sigma regulatory factor (Ser/Thr protein kinase)